MIAAMDIVVREGVQQGTLIAFVGALALGLLWTLLWLLKTLVSHLISHYVLKRAARKWGRQPKQEDDDAGTR